MKGKFGWRKEDPDPRDIKFRAPTGALVVPPLMDLSNFFPPVYDQGANDCTANAGEALFRAKLKQRGLPDFAGSRLGLYAMTRIYEDALAWDDGAFIRDTILMMLADGLIAESDWPYDLTKLHEKPPQALYHKALEHKAPKAIRITQDGTSAHGLASLARGDAFEFGMTLFDSFEDDKTLTSGIVPMPNLQREKPIGGHAMVCTGAILNSQMPFRLPNGAVLQKEARGGYLKVRNSWGPDIGVRGHLFLPFSIVFNEDYSNDFWAISSN